MRTCLLPRPSAASLMQRSFFPLDKLLTVRQTAERLGTSDRFPRRLIAERRIRYVKIGTHVRIPESAVDALIAANTVEPLEVRWRGGRAA
jgi:excisionase family DNA binding protein